MAVAELPDLPSLEGLTDVGRRAYVAVVLEGRSVAAVAFEEGVRPRVIWSRVGHAQRMLRDGVIARPRRAPGPPKPPRPRPAPPILVEPDVAPVLARARRHLTVMQNAQGQKTVRSVTVSGKLRIDEIAAGAAIERPDGVTRPTTRGQCAGVPRPCPFVSCRHHLYLDVNPESGGLKLNHPHLDVDEMTETCSLDVADRGGITLEEVGVITGITRERVRQIEENAVKLLARNPPGV